MKHPVEPEKLEIKYSEVILLGELQNSDPDQDPSYQRVQTYSSTLKSPLPVGISEKMLTRSSTKTKTTSMKDLSACPSIYSSILFPQHPLPPSYSNQPTDCQRGSVSLSNGVTEPPGLHLTPTDDHKFLSLCPKQHQSPFSFLNFGNEVALPKHPLTQSSFISPLLLQSNTLTHPDDSFPASFSSFLPSVFVDISYCPVECSPYISAD